MTVTCWGFSHAPRLLRSQILCRLDYSAQLSRFACIRVRKRSHTDTHGKDPAVYVSAKMTQQTLKSLRVEVGHSTQRSHLHFKGSSVSLPTTGTQSKRERGRRRIQNFLPSLSCKITVSRSVSQRSGFAKRLHIDCTAFSRLCQSS